MRVKHGSLFRNHHKLNQNTMTKKQTNVSLILSVVAVLGVAATLFYFTSSAKTTENQATAGTPAFTVDTEMIELGEIDVNGEYPADFTVTNTGDAPLEISRVKTSCMCTFAEVIIDGETSPSINMDMYMEGIHTYDEYLAAKRWTGKVAPGQSAIVRMIYKPHMMPVEGSVARNVKFATNDPQNRSVELGIHAIVK